MLRSLKQILALPVAAPQLADPVGRLEDYLLDPATGDIVAYRVRVGREVRYLSTVDISRYFDDGVLITNPDVLQPPDDLVRLRPFLENQVRVIGQPVVTEAGKKIGRVSDVYIELTDHKLARLHVRPGLLTRLFTEARILPREQVVQIEPKRIVVREDVTPAPAAEPEVPVA